jgi:cytochrome b561
MSEHDDRLSKALHWIVVALVLVQVATGLSWTQFDEESTARSVLFRIHMFSGMAILILMVVRLAWRRTSPWRPLPQDVPQGARVLARVNHVLLYGGLILQPLLGLLIISPLGGNDWEADAHEFLAWTLIVLVLLHVSGALWHGFVRRDGVMQRMLPLGTATGR